MILVCNNSRAPVAQISTSHIIIVYKQNVGFTGRHYKLMSRQVFSSYQGCNVFVCQIQ